MLYYLIKALNAKTYPALYLLCHLHGAQKMIGNVFIDEIFIPHNLPFGVSNQTLVCLGFARVLMRFKVIANFNQKDLKKCDVDRGFSLFTA